MSGCAFACAAKSSGGGYRRSSRNIVSIAAPRPSPASAPAGRSPAPPPPAAAGGTVLSGPVLLTLCPPAPHRQRRLRNTGTRPVLPSSRRQVVREVREVLGPVLGDEHDVLQPAAAEALAVETGLQGHDVTRHELHG